MKTASAFVGLYVVSLVYLLWSCGVSRFFVDFTLWSMVFVYSAYCAVVFLSRFNPMYYWFFWDAFVEIGFGTCLACIGIALLALGYSLFFVYSSGWWFVLGMYLVGMAITCVFFAAAFFNRECYERKLERLGF